MNDEQESERQKDSYQGIQIQNREEKQSRTDWLTSSVMDFHFSPPSFATFNQQVDRFSQSVSESIRWAGQQLLKVEETGWDEGKESWA